MTSPSICSAHLTPAEIETALQQASHPHLRLRLTAFQLLSQGYGAIQVAKMLGITRQTIYNWTQVFEKQGLEGIMNLRSSGRAPTADDNYRHLLEAILVSSPMALGYNTQQWTVSLLRQHLQNATGLSLSDGRFRDLLHDLGYEYRRLSSPVDTLLPPFPNNFADAKAWFAQREALRETLPADMFSPYHAWVKVLPEGGEEPCDMSNISARE